MYTAALIGATGAGDYGHSLDRAWGLVPEVEVVAVADVDADAARRKADQLGVRRAFGDYRQMLQEVRPDFVNVCTRQPNHHADMLLAAVEAGARGIYCEKPFVRTPAEADAVIAAASARGVKIQVAHTRRVDQQGRRMLALLREGAIGRLIAVHATGKNDDRRGGAEDLMVLGVHLVDQMREVAGDPIHVSADVFQSGRPVGLPDVHEGNENIGLIAGDQIFARFVFDHGVAGLLSSARTSAGGHRAMGIELIGTEGMISLRGGGPASGGQPLLVNRRPADDPGPDSVWEPVPTDPLTADGPVPAGEPGDGWQLLHTRMARDLLAAVEDDRRPVCDAIDGRWTIEMIMGVHEAGLTHQTVRFPLITRDNPYAVRRQASLADV